jgi:mRNA interferase RelE/StbE
MSPSYKIKIHRDVEKQLQRIPRNQRDRLVETMRALRDEPRPPGCVKLEDVLYRIRQGRYRIIYAIFDNEVVIVICKVARRAEDTYKNLQNMLDRAENLLNQE